MHSLPSRLASDSLSPSDVVPAVSAPESAAGNLATFGRLRAALHVYQENPANSELRVDLMNARQAAAEFIAQLPRKEKQSALADEARDLVRELSESGVHDRSALPADLILAGQLAEKDWPGLLAAMLMVPAWQWSEAPKLLFVPENLRVDFVSWLFAAPKGFSEISQAEKYATFVLARLEELTRWLNRNPPAHEVKGILHAYARSASAIPLYFSTGSLRRHAELRGRLLQRLFVRPSDRYDPSALPRAGRRLRVGFVSRHFGPQTETYTTLPTFEQLDPERFEVILFACHASDSPLEAYCRQNSAEFFLLPDQIEEQLAQLRAAELDVVVFGTNVTAVFNEITRIALHRVAPLQVINNSSCITSGIATIDLYLSGTLTETAEAEAHFSERLALVPGPTHAFNYTADQQEAQVSLSRGDFGLPEGSVVFVSAANYFKIIPEVQHAWAQLLASVPGSYLLLHPFNPNWSSNYPMVRFQQEFAAVLAAHGVDSSRLAISTQSFPSRTDVKTLLGLGDVYLDTFPFGGVNSLIDPLELALPVVAWEGETFRSRMGAALLREMNLPELIASDATSYHALAVKLATDPDYRRSQSEAIRVKMERTPLFLDSLAASEACGDLLETAYDELATVGRSAFSTRREPLLAARSTPSISENTELDRARDTLRSSPANAAARHQVGRELLATGQVKRALTYLLAALQGEEAKADLWLDVARALRANGQGHEALQALEAGLRIDETQVEGWSLFTQFAEELGSLELAGEARQILARLQVGELVAAGSEPTLAGDVRKHILLYTDDPDSGGVAQYNHTLLCGLARAGYRVTCLQSRADTPLMAEQRELGVAHRWIGLHTGREFGRTLTEATEAEELFVGDRPDLVIFSDCCPVSNLAARTAAQNQGIPFITVVGFVGEYLAKNFAAYLPTLASHYAEARAVIAVSQENLDLLRARFGLPTAAGQVVHYGRPEKFFAPRSEAVRAKLRAEIGLPMDAVLCFTAARLTAVKGFRYQIEAAQKLARLPGGDRVHFVWAGEGEQRAELEKAIADAGLRKRFHLLGHRWDVADWYDAADIFALPSDLEGMPLAIMEAMAKGVPVVATAVSGIPEELGDTGRLLPAAVRDRAGLVTDLARTLHLWAHDAALRTRLGAAGRERAILLFREELMFERTLILVESILMEAAMTMPEVAAV